MQFIINNKYKLLIIGTILTALVAVGVVCPDNVFEQVAEALICRATGFKTDLSPSKPDQPEKMINMEYLEDALDCIKIVDEDGKTKILLKIPEKKAEKD